MLITLALITYTALIERNYSFSKLCGSFQQRPTLQTKQPVGIGLSDAQRLLPEHGNGRVPGKAPAHVRARKQEVQTKHFHSQQSRLGCTGCGCSGSCGDGKGMQPLGLPYPYLAGWGWRDPQQHVGGSGRGGAAAAQGLIGAHTRAPSRAHGLPNSRAHGLIPAPTPARTG